jgi:hypothetical protein
MFIHYSILLITNIKLSRGAAYSTEFNFYLCCTYHTQNNKSKMCNMSEMSSEKLKPKFKIFKMSEIIMDLLFCIW